MNGLSSRVLADVVIRVQIDALVVRYSRPAQNRPAVSAPARKSRRPGRVAADNEASLIDMMAHRFTFSLRDNQAACYDGGHHRGTKIARRKQIG
jgi:hypothetical protein